MISFRWAVGGSISLIFTIIRLLLLLPHFLAESQGTHSLVDSDLNNHFHHSKTREHRHTQGSCLLPREKVRMNWLVFGVLRTGGLIPKGLAELATEEIEIVDRFGDWHDLIGLKAREHFWADGFAIDTPGRIFSTMHSSTCFTRWNAGIAQATVSFNKGIALEGGERIPPFSEIHTFPLVRVEGG